MDTLPRRLPPFALFLGTIALSTLLSAALCQRAQSASPPAPLAAARAPEPRTLSVQGQAEIGTMPDEVTIVVRINSFHASLKQAKQDNDQRARTLLAKLPTLGVDAKNAQTDEFTIGPRYEGSYDKRVLVGYEVSKRITLTLCEIEQADVLLGELFEKGANVLERVSFAPSKLIEKRAEARILAVKAAQQKAEAMAKELGQRLGRPLKVDDTTDSQYVNHVASNVYLNNESPQASSQTLAAGRARVQASVAVVFELQE